jgi:hypothetical protein
LTRNIRQLIISSSLASPRFTKRISNKELVKDGGIPQVFESNDSLPHGLKCYIWAVTAMNEDDIQVHVQSGLLDGISVKPLSLKQVEKIIIRSGIEYTKSDKDE